MSTTLFFAAAIFCVILSVLKIKVFEFLFKVLAYSLKYSIIFIAMATFVAMLQGLKGV